MKIFRNLVPLLILIQLLACNQKPEALQDENFIHGLWRLSESTNNKKSQNEDPLLADAEKLEESRIGKVLSIFPDNSYTELDGNSKYIHGNWEWIEEGEVIALNDGMSKSIYNLKAEIIETDKIKITLENKSKKYVYVQSVKLLKDFKAEPFYSENNLWRIKPKKSENKKQIIDRLGNYFKHMIYLLKAADERKLDVISFEFSMGIVKIYNGGIGVEDFQNIPDAWKNSFYSIEEAEIAHKSFSDYSYASSFRGASTGNWVVDDASILVGIYADLKEGKFQ